MVKILHFPKMFYFFISNCVNILNTMFLSQHHLFDCVNLTELRERFLPAKPNIHKCLYGSSEQMRQTCSFFKLASGKRAKAHMPLVR